MKVSSLVILALVLISVPSALAQQVDKPSIAILRFWLLAIRRNHLRRDFGYSRIVWIHYRNGWRIRYRRKPGFSKRAGNRNQGRGDARSCGGNPGREACKVSRRVSWRRLRGRGVIIPMEARQEEDMAWLASLRCTHEIIAEQQAELDAAE